MQTGLGRGTWVPGTIHGLPMWAKHHEAPESGVRLKGIRGDGGCGEDVAGLGGDGGLGGNWLELTRPSNRASQRVESLGRVTSIRDAVSLMLMAELAKTAARCVEKSPGLGWLRGDRLQDGESRGTRGRLWAPGGRAVLLVPIKNRDH